MSNLSFCIPVRHYSPQLPAILRVIPHNVEVCIFDNGSDATETYDAFDSAPTPTDRVYQISRQVLPLAESWRSCLRMATRDLIILRSSNDPLDPQIIPELSAPLLADPSIDFTVCREEATNAPGLDEQYQRINNTCQYLCDPSVLKSDRMAVLKRCIQENFLGNMYKVMFRRKCLPADWWGMEHGYFSPMGFFDWRFMLHLFLNHRGHFANKALHRQDLGPRSPWGKLRGDPGKLAMAQAMNLMPTLAVLADPSLSELKAAFTLPERRELAAWVGAMTSELANA